MVILIAISTVTLKTKKKGQLRPKISIFYVKLNKKLADYFLFFLVVSRYVMASFSNYNGTLNTFV